MTDSSQGLSCALLTNVNLRPAALNIIDIKLTKMPFAFAQYFPDCPKEQEPLVLGQDFAGVVESVGDDVTTVKVGDRVYVSYRACNRELAN